MELRPDRGGVFASDQHRRVLGHLSLPTESVGYTLGALHARMVPDEHTDLDAKQILVVLRDLKKDKLAREHAGGVWQQTQAGFDALTGPIADEPPPGAKPQRPARLDAPTPISGVSS